ARHRDRDPGAFALLAARHRHRPWPGGAHQVVDLDGRRLTRMAQLAGVARQNEILRPVVSAFTEQNLPPCATARVAPKPADPLIEYAGLSMRTATAGSRLHGTAVHHHTRMEFRQPQGAILAIEAAHGLLHANRARYRL